MQILPSLPLSPYIRHYLFLDSDDPGIKKLRLFSDGSTGLVFSFKNRLRSEEKKATEQNFLPGSFLYGQLENYRNLYSGGKTALLIVVFHPHGIRQLLGIPAQELQGQIIPIEFLFGPAGKELQDSLSESKIPQLIPILESFLLKLAAKNHSSPSFIEASVQLIVQTRGQLSSEQLSRFTGYQERQIERKFAEYIGLSPKKFCSIIRLHDFIKQLRNTLPNHHFTTMGYSSGYYDQSHQIREFKKITGLTPSQYQNAGTTLAVNFLKVLMDNLKIATAQFENKSGDKNYNLSVIEKLAATAAADGALVVTFHECSITGYTFAQKLSKTQMLDLAEHIPDGPSIKRLTQIAGKYNITILAGLFEKDENDQLFKAYVCVGPDGLIAKYRKLHPFINPHLNAGTEYCVFDLQGWKCGILICYDNNIIENVR
eukprot:gene15192-18370_t